jgi:hypothetical protein
MEDPASPLAREYALHVIRVHQIAADTGRWCKWTRRLAAVHEAGHCVAFTGWA